MKPPKKYQPSNGTEGMGFIDEYCMNCLHCDPDPSGPKQCIILGHSMAYDINDPEYPSEWIQDDDGENPRCTKWQKWDWGNDGDPDDRDNPKRPIPIDPNQLCMPFILDEIVVETKQEPILVSSLN